MLIIISFNFLNALISDKSRVDVIWCTCERR